MLSVTGFKLMTSFLQKEVISTNWDVEQFGEARFRIVCTKITYSPCDAIGNCYCRIFLAPSQQVPTGESTSSFAPSNRLISPVLTRLNCANFQCLFLAFLNREEDN